MKLKSAGEEGISAVVSTGLTGGRPVSHVGVTAAEAAADNLASETLSWAKCRELSSATRHTFPGQGGVLYEHWYFIFIMIIIIAPTIKGRGES